MPKRISIVGMTFGRLTVVKFSHKNNRRQSLWLCKCSCGKETTVEGYALRAGKIKSCGCFRAETSSIVNSTHKMSHTREYAAYCHAKGRCENSNLLEWKDYGGREIKFLFNDFEQFFEELGPRPSGKSIDRINNDGNYEPGNVRWATPVEQRANRRPDGLMLQMARHTRWHINRNIIKSDCLFCKDAKQ